MKTVRLSGLVAALVAVFGAGTGAADELGYSCPQAGDYANGYPRNRAYLVDWTKEFGRYVRCVDYPSNLLPGQWNPDDPVWQWRGDAGKGCEVHWKLSKQLNEENDSGTTPTKKGSKNNRGAANALEEKNDDDAVLRLQTFIDTILYDAVVVQFDHEVTAPDGSKISHTITDHEAIEQDLVWEAGEIIRCIGDMKD